MMTEVVESQIIEDRTSWTAEATIRHQHKYRCSLHGSRFWNDCCAVPWGTDENNRRYNVLSQEYR